MNAPSRQDPDMAAGYMSGFANELATEALTMSSVMTRESPAPTAAVAPPCTAPDAVADAVACCMAATLTDPEAASVAPTRSSGGFPGGADRRSRSLAYLGTPLPAALARVYRESHEKESTFNNAL